MVRPPPVQVRAGSPHPLTPSNALSPSSKAERESSRNDPRKAKKVKLTLQDYMAELASEEAGAQPSETPRSTLRASEPAAGHSGEKAAAVAKPTSVRTLQRMHLMPLIDLV